MQYFAKLLICCVALHSLFASAKESKVRLKSSDDVMFEVDQAVAFESQTIKNMIEDMGTESAVLLPDVSGKILAKVIEYCRYHVNAAKTTDEKIAIWEEDVKKWYQEFVKVDQATLFDLVVGQGFVENFYHIDRVPEKSAILEEDAKKWDPDVVKVDQATFLDHVLGSGFVEVSCHIGRFPEKSAMSEEDVKKWDLEFVKVDQATLFNLVLDHGTKVKVIDPAFSPDALCLYAIFSLHGIMAHPAEHIFAGWGKISKLKSQKHPLKHPRWQGRVKQVKQTANNEF